MQGLNFDTICCHLLDRQHAAITSHEHRSLCCALVCQMHMPNDSLKLMCLLRCGFTDDLNFRHGDKKPQISSYQRPHRLQWPHSAMAGLMGLTLLSPEGLVSDMKSQAALQSYTHSASYMCHDSCCRYSSYHCKVLPSQV